MCGEFISIIIFLEQEYRAIFEEIQADKTLEDKFFEYEVRLIWNFMSNF